MATDKTELAVAGLSKAARRDLLRDLATEVLHLDRSIVPLHKRSFKDRVKAKAAEVGHRYVYVISDGRYSVKIGIASDPNRRLRELQTGCALKLRLSHKMLCALGAERAIEQRCHAELQAHRMSGEWFDVEVETARNVVNRAVSDLGGSPTIIERRRYSHRQQSQARQAG